MDRFGQIRARIERRHLLLVGVAVLVALSGCSGTGNDGTATATPNGTEIEPVDATAQEVIGPAIDAMEGVDAYRVTGTLNQSIRSENSQQNVTLEVDTSVDRSAMRVQSTQTASGFGRTITTDSYIVDGTVYQRSEQFTAQYNSEWIRIEIPDEFDDQFNRNDELATHRVMLQNASVELVGAQEIDGQRTYRLEVDADEEALAAFYGFDDGSITIESANATVWISTDTDRLVRSKGRIRQQVTAQGQQVTTVSTYDERFTYEGVDITLPDAASSAVEVNATTGLAT